MKIQILRENQQAIENYTKIIVGDNQIDLSSISDNESSFILANDILDSFSVVNIDQLIKSIIKKLRINGSVVIGGTEMRLFCKNVLNGSINTGQASNIISLTQSMSTINDIVDLIKSSGLNIESTLIRGVHYEVKAKRG